MLLKKSLFNTRVSFDILILPFRGTQIAGKADFFEIPNSLLTNTCRGQINFTCNFRDRKSMFCRLKILFHSSNNAKQMVKSNFQIFKAHNN